MNPDSSTPSPVALWYYVNNAATLGPVTFSELEAHLKAGTITLETLVVPEGQEDWKPFGSYLPSRATETGPQSVSSAGQGDDSGTPATGVENDATPPRLPSANRPHQSVSSRARTIHERAEGERKGYKKGCGGCLVLIVLVFLISTLFETCSAPDLSLSKSELENPQVAVEKLMKGIYGSKFREASATAIYSDGAAGGKLNVYVRVNADMLLSNSSTMFGMDDKMKKAFKALYESGLPLWEVVIWNYAPLVDRYGKQSDEIVYKVGLQSREASQVEWSHLDSVSFEKVWEVKFLHPVLTR